MRMGCKSASFILFLLALLASCVRQKTITREELASKIKSAISVAAESELFIRYVHEGRSTRHYAEEHVTYLQQLTEDDVKELDQWEAEPGIEDTMHEYRVQLVALREALSHVQAAIGEDAELAAIMHRLTNIRGRLQLANAGQ